MTEFTVHTEKTTPEASKDLVKAIKDKYGLLSNFFAVQSESPAMLEGYVALTRIFNKTNLSGLPFPTLSNFAGQFGEISTGIALLTLLVIGK